MEERVLSLSLLFETVQRRSLRPLFNADIQQALIAVYNRLVPTQLVVQLPQRFSTAVTTRSWLTQRELWTSATMLLRRPRRRD